MSREIKFRVWDKVNERMLNIETLGLSFSPNGVLTSIYTYGPDFSNDPEVIGHDEPDLDDVTIEQYTGLKDANGKEIYEGDILAWHSSICRKHNWVGVVLYRGAGFAVQESDKSYSSPEWLDCACRKDANIIEVIGNIHENPDLLEVDK